MLPAPPCTMIRGLIGKIFLSMLEYMLGADFPFIAEYIERSDGLPKEFTRCSRSQGSEEKIIDLYEPA